MKTCLSFVFCAIFVTCFLRGASSLNVTITASPSRAAKESRVFVRCSTEPREAISGCQFRLWYVGKQQEGAMFNVTRGDNKVEIPNPYSTGTSYTAQLFSSHFDKGVCDVTLEKVKGDHFVVGCKLTTKSHRSGVETTPIFFTDTLPLKLVKNETTLIVSAEESVNISLQTEGSVGLRNCNATLPNRDKLIVYKGSGPGNHNLVTRHRNSAYHPDPEYTPYGGKLAEGECGFIINKVMERHNGVFFVLAYGKDGKSVGAMAVTLVVKPKRRNIKMTISLDKDEYDFGDNMTVKCTASAVPRPAVEWRWGWGNPTTNVEEALTDHQQGDAIEGWSWPWQDAVFSQNVTFTLRQEHHGKMIRCSLLFKDQAYPVNTQKKPIKIKPKTTPASDVTGGGSSGQPPTSPSTPARTPPPPTTTKTTILTSAPPTTTTTTKKAFDEKKNMDSTTTIESPIDTPMDINTGPPMEKIYIIVGVVAALLAAAIISAVGLCAFFKVACFKDRSRASLIKPGPPSRNEGDAIQIIAVSESQPKKPKEGPRKPNKLDPKKLEPKKLEPPKTPAKKPQPLQRPALKPHASAAETPPSSQHLEETQPLQPAALTTATAQIEEVQYAQIMKKKKKKGEAPTPTQTPSPTLPAEVVQYAELNWADVEKKE